MRHPTALVFAIVTALIGTTVRAARVDRVPTRGTRGTDHGAPLATSMTSRDTIYLMGGDGAPGFQDQYGNPDWGGWSHRDDTGDAEPRWHVADFNVVSGALSDWCGTTYANDCAEGYGNGWRQNLVFSHPVADPDEATTVTIEATFNCDTEPGFDFFRIQQNRGGIWEDVAGPYDGTIMAQTVGATVSFEPQDYVEGTLELRFRGESDIGWSDEDCLVDTEGLAQVDDIIVTIADGPTYTEDFEDGVSDDWHPVPESFVGDFAQLWVGLQDMDPCRSNVSPQAAFIDDGFVVPGTGGSPCVTWCYGPGGFIVNCTGGLAGPEYHISNVVVSPVLAWPEDLQGAQLLFDVYRHEPLTASSPGMFYMWHVRSVDTDNPADIVNADWRDRGLVYFGGPEYVRFAEDITDLLVQGRTHVQAGLRVVEAGWVWGYDGIDGTPAPYFDNPTLVAYPHGGPAIASREIDRANDGFSERGDVDLTDLASNWIRFDMAADITGTADPRNVPGDSITFDIALPRAGSVLHRMPRMYVAMRANPLFDAVRMLPPNFTQTGDLITGHTDGRITYNQNGMIIEDRYNFDLPDSSFFFPGDVIHYLVEAVDELPDGSTGISIAPADTSGWLDFDDPLGYDEGFTVHGLPTLFDAGGEQPRILFWDDFGIFGGENEWYFALGNLGYSYRQDYDVYHTNGPSTEAGNGIGGRATSATLAGYDVLLYSSGILSTGTIANGDRSGDIYVLGNWFDLGTAQGRKHALLTGDNLAFSLTQAGPDAAAFLSTYVSGTLVDQDVANLIGGQTAPSVRPFAGNSLVVTPAEWVTFGGCPSPRRFDAVDAAGTAERLAEFLDPGGNGGVYSHAAALRQITTKSDVVFLPYDFMTVRNPPGYVPGQPGLTARAELLSDVLIAFGQTPDGQPTGIPALDVLALTSHPNPFNPRTIIELSLPHAGHVSLKIFDLRGRLVSNLADGRMAAGKYEIVWDGLSDAGSPAASGVYFAEARFESEVEIQKLTLVR